MYFWLLCVKTTVNVNGKDVAFDYTNTYLSRDEAVERADFLKRNNDVLDITIHKWILKDDGTEEHFEGRDDVCLYYHNYNHREELKEV